MKKVALLFGCALLMSSCLKESTPSNPDNDLPIIKNIAHFLTSEEFDVPIQDGYVTQVYLDEDLIAEAISPMRIMLPKQSSDKAGESRIVYVPKSEYPNEIDLENRAKLYQVICFEDSRNADYDYNDLVIHVLYKTQGSKFGFGVQPVALGSTKSIKLGCTVYKGDVQIFQGLITPEGKDARSQYFESQPGFINTVGKTVNQDNGGWSSYLGSTIRNWNINKYPGKGAMRVEWYIEVDNGIKLYALSTTYQNQSFDKNGLPYGLVITDTGAEYNHNGEACGHDWFNYPQESQSIKNVYPEIWEWLTTDRTFDFKTIYNQSDTPVNAFPASDLGLFITSDANVLDGRYSQN